VRSDLAKLRRLHRTRAAEDAKVAARRQTLRQLEHDLDVGLRQTLDLPRYGLAWAELGRGRCQVCSGDGRLWMGSWFEYVVAPGWLPFAIVSTPSLRAGYTVQRQLEERTRPIWRPAPAPRLRRAA
jgi:hypothetical protein